MSSSLSSHVGLRRPLTALALLAIVALATAGPLSLRTTVAADPATANNPTANAATTEAAAPRDPARWEKAIADYEAQDRQQAPPQGGAVFVGSSSIRLWKLDRSFPNLPAVNRGFGGSELADSVHFADRLITPHRPRAVVVYAGDNDLSRGVSPEKVADDYRRLAETIRRDLPEARIVYIGIKPSLKRWALIEKVRQANALIREATEADDRQAFVDVDAPMLGDDGQPRPELFAADGLHLSEQGYALWTKLVRPHLQAAGLKSPAGSDAPPPSQRKAG